MTGADLAVGGVAPRGQTERDEPGKDQSRAETGATQEQPRRQPSPPPRPEDTEEEQRGEQDHRRLPQSAGQSEEGAGQKKPTAPLLHPQCRPGEDDRPASYERSDKWQLSSRT